MTMDQEKKQVADLVLSVLSETSGNQLEDIHLESNLTTELNFTREDCIRLIKSVEKTYNAQLQPGQAPIDLTPLLEEDELEEIETVGVLIDAIFNEVELG